jgi:hypothetical protein
MYPQCGYTIFWSIQPLLLLPLTPLLPTIHFSKAFNTFYDITDALAFSFPLPLSLSSIDQFHCYKHV